jgi:sec-independent protein translocase protein TatC
MTVLAVPLCVLVLLSYLVARANDIRRGRRDVNYADLSDDEASPLDDRPAPLDDPGRHRLRDDDDDIT